VAVALAARAEAVVVLTRTTLEPNRTKLLRLEAQTT